ncbi:hypothetical protein [Arsenicibacter rosenii]|uniref:Uncharacterized protein n=1 Tax=Arsenicibacter rosenii TaxID=1750698 RepID=A0A1S2VPQ1_9BACT|nr:hypothetical protein [Arsenicibacter rosenii]OIN59768.1 hypothetical protein BLX24_07890 [Arsenicibacter rosenii]
MKTIAPDALKEGYLAYLKAGNDPSGTVNQYLNTRDDCCSLPFPEKTKLGDGLLRDLEAEGLILRDRYMARLTETGHKAAEKGYRKWRKRQTFGKVVEAIEKRGVLSNIAMACLATAVAAIVGYYTVYPPAKPAPVSKPDSVIRSDTGGKAPEAALKSGSGK